MAEKPRRVAIVGAAPSSVGLAPYGDDTWEIWAHARYAHLLPRVTRSFEMHRKRYDGDTDDRWGSDWDAHLRNLPGLTMLEGEHEPYAAEPYPYEVIAAWWGGPLQFTSTACHMMAYALFLGATEIGLWGIDLAHGSEYGPQRPAVIGWVMAAHAMGVRVTVAEQSPLMKIPFLYGVERPVAFEDSPEQQGRLVEEYKRLSSLQRQRADDLSADLAALGNDTEISPQERLRAHIELVASIAGATGFAAAMDAAALAFTDMAQGIDPRGRITVKET